MSLFGLETTPLHCDALGDETQRRGWAGARPGWDGPAHPRPGSLVSLRKDKPLVGGGAGLGMVGKTGKKKKKNQVDGSPAGCGGDV